MEELNLEARKIYDLLKNLTKKVVEGNLNVHRSFATHAMAELIRDNDAKFAAIHTKVDDA
jgi:hypothetical protein